MSARQAAIKRRSNCPQSTCGGCNCKHNKCKATCKDAHCVGQLKLQRHSSASNSSVSCCNFSASCSSRCSDLSGSHQLRRLPLLLYAAPVLHTHTSIPLCCIGCNKLKPLALATLPCAVHVHVPLSSPCQLPLHRLPPLLACLCANHLCRVQALRDS